MQTEEQNLQDAMNAQNAEAYQDTKMQETSSQVSEAEAAAAAEAVAAAADGETAGAEEQSSDPQMEIALLRTQVQVLAQKAKEDHDSMLRAVAEADNARKRAEADVERERKFAMEKFIKAIIPVYDSLDRALELSDRNDPASKATLDGVESTITLLLKELGAFGLECINPVGEAFNPNVHQAISVAPSAEMAPNHVLAVMQKGFILNGRVVRPAMVMVSKAAEPAENKESGSINVQA